MLGKFEGSTEYWHKMENELEYSFSVRGGGANDG